MHKHFDAQRGASGSHIEEAGATEIAFQPAGPDIPGELEALAEAARG